MTPAQPWQGGDPETGKQMFVSRGCRGCHAIEMGQRSVESRVPNLAGVGLKVKSAFAEDQTLFVDQAGLWRSTDGGDSWAEVPGPSQVAFSPAFSFLADGALASCFWVCFCCAY